MHNILGLIKETYPCVPATWRSPGKILKKASLKFAWNTSWAIAKAPARITRPKRITTHNIEEITDILNGKIGAVLRNLKADMDNAVADMNFELAHRLKTKIRPAGELPEQINRGKFVHYRC